MDLACLLGVCSAAAQPAAEAASAAAAQAASAAASQFEPARNATLVFTWLGIALFVAAQGLAKLLMPVYRARVLAAMNRVAPPDRGDSGWTPERIRDAMDGARRRMLRLLVIVVAVYSVVAALIYAHRFPSTMAYGVSLAVSVLLFAAFSGPVALLGVSASRFASHYWNGFAPAAFAAVAMQIVVAQASLNDSPEARHEAAVAMGGVLAVTALVIGLRLFAGNERMARWGEWLHRLRLGFAAAFVIIALVLAGVMRNTPHVPVSLRVGFGCAVAAAAITLCYLTMIDRLQRILVPLAALALVVFGIAATVAGFVFAWVFEDWGGAGTGLAVALGLAFGAWFARHVLGWVALAYDNKVFGESQFQVYAWMAAVACIVIFAEVLLNPRVVLGETRILTLAGATGVALVVYSLALRWFVRPLGVHRRLLVLRVFSHDERAQETVLEDLEYRWRFIGPIVLIGGTDYAQRTMDPSDAAHFLRSLRVDDRFVTNGRELDRQLLAIDEAPDPDGRYRVNELFCGGSAWQEAVSKLLDSSEAVLVDLREYNDQRRGTKWELELLKTHGALARTVLLIGDATQMPDVLAALDVPDEAALRALAGVVDMRTDERHALVERLLRRLPAAPLPPLTLQVAPARSAGSA